MKWKNRDFGRKAVLLTSDGREVAQVEQSRQYGHLHRGPGGWDWRSVLCFGNHGREDTKEQAQAAAERATRSGIEGTRLNKQSHIDKLAENLQKIRDDLAEFERAVVVFERESGEGTSQGDNT